MAATAPGTPNYRDMQRSRDGGELKQTAERAGRAAKKEVGNLARFWTKLNNDWVFNFSGTLAYGFLTSIFPILLVIIAIGGFLLGAMGTASRTQLENSIAGTLPGGVSGIGGQIVRAATRSLNSSAPALLIFGIVVALIAGSGLFVTMENIFGVIFRLRGRNPIHQRIMSIGMLLIFAVLVPVIVVASSVPPIVLHALNIGTSNPVAGFFIQALGVAVAFVFAAIFFAAIYIVVPNKPVNLKEVVKGTLAAAALLVLYETLFPFYESYFLHPGNYGSIVGFALVIIIFFYYLAFILLLGAEVNSWALGQRETAGSLDAILHEVQAHNTTRGAAGPTAGLPQEDLQDGKGASAMEHTPNAIAHERQDHRDDARPPKYAESGVVGSRYRLNEQYHPDEEQPGTKLGALPSRHLSGASSDISEVATSGARTRTVTLPMSAREKKTLAALAASGAVALAGVARFAARLLGSDKREMAAD